MKRKWIPYLLATAVAVSAITVWAMMSPGGELLPQPIAFNHRLHLERVQGISCLDCHRFAGTETYAGLPSKHLCFECHEPAVGDDETDLQIAALAPLREFAGPDAGEIPWHRVTATREDVFFSHRRHVTAGEIDCRRCHAEIPDRTSPPTHGPIEMTMDTCLRCHDEARASADCIACHK